MNLQRRALLAAAAPALVLGAWVALTAGMVWATLAPAERDLLSEVLASRLALVLMAWMVVSVLLAMLAQRLFRDHVAAVAQLDEATRVHLAQRSDAALPDAGGSAVRSLAQAIGALVAQRSALQDDMQQQVQSASRQVDQERRRLAALMAELTQSVVVCNLDGQVLLYNQRARLQFRTLSGTPGLAEGASGLIGLGRSIYTVFERPLVDHALETIRQRLARGVAQPSAQFVTTTRGGQLLRVQMAAVLDQPGPVLGGFVLMLDNVTREFEQEALRDQLLHAMTEGSRGALANLQAAVDMLGYPDLEPAMHARFLGVVREETAALTERVQHFAQTAATGLKTRWPMEDMRGADLLAAIARRIESAARLQVDAAPVDDALWLRVDSFSLMQALAYLAARLADEFGITQTGLRLSGAGPRAHLDLVWRGQVMSTETVMSWELDPMRIGNDATPLSVRDIVDRHGGAFWFERERTRHEAFFRFLLPLASGKDTTDGDAAPALSAGAERPEYYDFDLFQTSAVGSDLESRPLAGLAYTVFDTETTGLEPSAGDEIIQIGATRIVNGRLLPQEGFEQLVDPQRPISPASIPIHGIQPAMVAGQPTIDQVLPAFHAFAQDTVLVAHNAAFDMRFLQLKEERTGLRFDQPVLDTLLLSTVVHPHQESHALEAIAQRLGIAVQGRHTALGDATVTAQVFLKLLPLLADKGIHTLGQARAASRESYLARVGY
ncbi:MAG: exonuclease domain-containing protein [Rhodoferax sp.]